MTIVRNPSDFSPRSVVHQQAQLLVRDLASYNERIESFRISLEQLREHQNVLRIKKDTAKNAMQDSYDSSIEIASINFKKISEIKIKRQRISDQLKVAAALARDHDQSAQCSADNIHSKDADNLRIEISRLDQMIIQLRSEHLEWKSVHEAYRQDYFKARDRYNESWAELGRMEKLFSSMPSIRDRLIESLEIIAYNNAALVGVPLCALSEFKVVINSAGNCDYYYGGEGKPDGENHKHISADIYANTQYNRLHGAS